MPRGRRFAAVITAATTALAGLGLALMAPAAQAATTQTFVTMVSTPGDYIGGGQVKSYSLPTDQIDASYGDNGLSINVNAADSSWWYFDFHAPQGR